MTQHTKLWEPGAFVAAMEVADVCELTITVPKMNEFQARLGDKGYAIQTKVKRNRLTRAQVWWLGFAFGAACSLIGLLLAWWGK